MNGKWKNRAGLLLLIGALGVISIGTTVAYFSDSGTVTNKFTIGVHDVDLQEPEWHPEEGDGQEMYPGYTVYKNPTVKNLNSDETSQGVYVRMIIQIQDKNGNPIENTKALSLIKTTIRFDDTYTGSYSEIGSGKKLVQGKEPGYTLSELQKIPMVNPLFVLDSEKSTEGTLIFNYVGADGKGILKNGEEAVLFTGIAIPLDWSSEDIELAGEFVLEISQESVQSEGFSSMKDAFRSFPEEKQIRIVQSQERIYDE